MQDADAWYLAPTLDLADESLADASPLRHLSLGKSSHGAGSDELPSESRRNLVGSRAESDPRGWHAVMLAGGDHRPLTSPLLVRLLRCAT
jgi:hypothetical protein